MIYRLLNSIHYFLDIVIIIAKKDMFHLVVIKKDKSLYHRCCKTLRGAKISFSKLFKCMSFAENTKAHWSQEYPVEPFWREKIENVLGTPIN